MTAILKATPYGQLLPGHEARIAGSAIAPDVACERGYRSVIVKADLQLLGFSERQRNVPALLIPIRNVYGDLVTYQIRPDHPRIDKNGKALKYETVKGSRMALDVPSRARKWLGDPARPLFVTEGSRKADAAVSSGLCCVALQGVWSWRGKNEDDGTVALPDWEVVALNGRSVYIVFDSDVMQKVPVHKALARLKLLLESRQANVLVVYLPPGKGGAKVGLDDFLAAGGSVQDLCALATADLRPMPEGADRDSDFAKNQATRLVQLADEADLFHTSEGKTFASIEVAGHREVWALRRTGTSDAASFRTFLGRTFYKEEGQAPHAQALQDAIGVLAGKALFDGPEHAVHVRLAQCEEAVYLDLGNDAWEAVEIRPNGWQVVTDPPVKFRRPRGMFHLPTPVHGGNLNELRNFFNFGTEGNFILIVSWLVAALRPVGPYPVLCLQGEQGSAKSVGARVLRLLIDPNKTDLRAAPRSGRDLMIGANSSWILALDNLSALSPWLSDALCRLATGGGFAVRELYSDDEEALFDAQRPVLLNGIENLATRGDLLERTLTCCLTTIGDTSRRTEAELWGAFEAARSRLLGALLDVVSVALANVGSVRMTAKPRMADFAEWIVAGEPALPWSPGTFLATYQENRAVAQEIALEASSLGLAVQALVDQQGPWEGHASELLQLLNRRKGRDVPYPPGWPKNAASLGGALRGVVSALRSVGVIVKFGRSSRRRAITIRKAPQDPVIPVIAVIGDAPGQDDGEGRTTARDGTHADPIPQIEPKTEAKDDNDSNDGVLHPSSDQVPTSPLAAIVRKAVAEGFAAAGSNAEDEEVK